MFNVVNTNVPEQFSEETATFSGTKTKSARIISEMTKRRKRAEKTILVIADKNGVGVGKVVETILLQSIPDLTKYVVSRGETPNPNAILLATQATLLRAEEIATIAKAIDTTDDDSLQQIEAAETDAIETNNADANSILKPDVQAALTLAMSYLSKLHKARKGSGKLKDIIHGLKKQSKADGFDLNTSTLLGVPDHEPIGSKSPGGANLPNGFGLFDYTEGGSDAPAAGSTTTQTTTTGGGGFFDFLAKLTAGIKDLGGAVSGGITSTKDALGGLGGTLSNIGGDAGAIAVDRSISKYIPYIIGGVILFTIIIVIAIYASKRK